MAMKIEATNSTEATRLYGRHFDHKVRTAADVSYRLLHGKYCVGSSDAIAWMHCSQIQSRWGQEFELRACRQPPAGAQLTSACVQDELVSRISRKSIDLLKEHFRDDMSKDEWRLILKLKKTFGID